ncbi:hypothetical protein LTR56_016597 [Elasticomyces elasticus]|nr:hypothetical protein LTR56_016597 [Elasticomyces elasticus]KAK3650628.1 hypothetical protein LTR22_012486 [Elasticomyces elasticus]KAK4913961.1 hypothetical protein LTR49_017779 [Elasticomyces elasticus]KAK5753125.1 hypothetical protein LTS12_016804 [Elasticomyces elasticus]
MAIPKASLLGLPAELRVMIYNVLFAALLTHKPEQMDIYVMPEDWPHINATDYTNGLMSYTSLSKICTQLRTEVKAHFYHLYLPDLVLYYDNVAELRQLEEQLRKYDPQLYRLLHFCLRSPTRSEVSVEKPEGTTFFDIITLANLSVPEMLFGGSWSDGSRFGVHAALEKRTHDGSGSGTKTEIARFRHAAPFEVTVHRHDGCGDTDYAIMTGILGDLDWTCLMDAYKELKYHFESVEDGLHFSHGMFTPTSLAADMPEDFALSYCVSS